MGVFFPNKALRILLVTDTIIFFAGAMFGPTYAIFVEQINGTVFDAGLTGGIYALVAGIVTLISGMYSDKILRNDLIVVSGYLLVAVGYTLFLFVSSVYTLFLVEIFLGVGAGIHMPAYKALYTKNLDSNREGVEWALWESMTYFAIAAGAALGGYMAYVYGFNTVFLGMAALCIFSGLFILLQPRSRFRLSAKDWKNGLRKDRLTRF